MKLSRVAITMDSSYSSRACLPMIYPPMLCYLGLRVHVTASHRDMCNSTLLPACNLRGVPPDMQSTNRHLICGFTVHRGNTHHSFPPVSMDRASPAYKYIVGYGSLTQTSPKSPLGEKSKWLFNQDLPYRASRREHQGPNVLEVGRPTTIYPLYGSPVCTGHDRRSRRDDNILFEEEYSPA
jgi:hypothetical protein